jgi:hypothetical protein
MSNDLDLAIRAKLADDPYGDVARAVAAVLDLHTVFPGCCDECTDESGDPQVYPCRTVRAIAKALGVNT